MDRSALKIQALLEKISNLTTNYENREADLRVEITLLNERIKELETEDSDDIKEETD